MRLIDEPGTEVTLTMRAPIHAIWRACIDPALPLENSPELVKADWDPDGPAPGLGARLLGTNRAGDREWSTVSNVVEWAPPFAWSFEVGMGAEAEVAGGIALMITGMAPSPSPKAFDWGRVSPGLPPPSTANRNWKKKSSLEGSTS